MSLQMLRNTKFRYITTELHRNNIPVTPVAGVLLPLIHFKEKPYTLTFAIVNGGV